MKYLLKWRLLLCACAAAWLLAGCGSQDGPKRVRLTYSIFFPSTHANSILAKEWAEELERRTKGRVHVDLFYASVLSGASENFDCVVNGVSDLGMSCFAYAGGIFPLTEGLDLPLGYPDGKTATLIANEYLQKFHPPELEDAHMLYIHAHGPGVLATKDPIEKIDDLRNMAIRGTGITARVVKALGGNAIGMPQGDTYEALHKGVVKGTVCPIETLKGWKQGEAINHVTKVPAIGYTTSMYVVMNKKTWNKLPPDIQKIIEELCQEWIPKHGAAWDEADRAGYAFVKSLGKSYHKISNTENARAEKLLEPMLEAWAKQAEARGVPGRELIRFCKERIKFYESKGITPPYPYDLDAAQPGLKEGK